MVLKGCIRKVTPRSFLGRIVFLLKIPILLLNVCFEPLYAQTTRPVNDERSVEILRRPDRSGIINWFSFESFEADASRKERKTDTAEFNPPSCSPEDWITYTFQTDFKDTLTEPPKTNLETKPRISQSPVFSLNKIQFIKINPAERYMLRSGWDE